MKKILIIATIALVAIIVGCNDDYMQREPTHNLNDPAYWKSTNDLALYNNGIYDVFAKSYWRGNGPTAFGSSNASAYAVEAQSDNMASVASGHTSLVRKGAGRNTISNASGWSFDTLRRINVFFDNYKRVEEDFERVKPFLGEAHLFRAWFYYETVQKFGDVPWVTKALTLDDVDILYGSRTPRKEVMDNVIEDLRKAIEYLPTKWSDAAKYPDRMTKWTALAAMSRIALYEGTYRKYHNLGDEAKPLEEAAKAAEQIIDQSPYKIYNTGHPDKDYRTLFTSEDLRNNSEVIFPLVYALPGRAHRVSGYIVSLEAGATKDFVDDFLINENGKALPITLSTMYDDSEFSKTFDNRDPRLKQTVLHPDEAADLVLNPAANGYPNLMGMSGSWQSPTGYHIIKSYEKNDDNRGQNSEINDYPLIRLAEVLLNFAEAKYELTGTLSQADIDKSLNKLRARAGMPNFDPKPQLDPKYASEGLSALLIEIRRERRVELSFEDFRFTDLMRWKKGSYLAKPVLGMRLEDVDRLPGTRYEKAKSITTTVNGKKYISVYAGTEFAERSFREERDYLEPIPLNQLALNPELKQNPNWE